MERVTGIGPVSQPWEGRVLPLNHTRETDDGEWKIEDGFLSRIHLLLTTRYSPLD